jgi:DNA invertase Pin-like site-specific DNA recombinase
MRTTMEMTIGGLAEFERELIFARTSDGRTRAKAKGVRFGRPAYPPSWRRRLPAIAEPALPAFGQSLARFSSGAHFTVPHNMKPIAAEGRLPIEVFA